MRMWMRVHITKGEKEIVGRLFVKTDSPKYIMADGCVCKKAYMQCNGELIDVKVHFSSKNKINKVYIENEVWDVKEQYIDVHNMFKAHRKKSWDFITELPESKPEQQPEPNPKKGKKRGRKEK